MPEDADQSADPPTPAPPAPAPPSYEPGAKVELRRRLDGRWARGFEVIARVEGSYRIRRMSDGQELPITIAADDLRAPRRATGWWY